MKLLSWTNLAWAQAGEATATPSAKGPSLFETMLLPLGFLVIMYFLMIRPQQKKVREQQDFLTKLKAGDEVLTSGGIIGRVRSVAETFVTVEISANTAIKVLKANVTPLSKEPPAAAAKAQPEKA